MTASSPPAVSLAFPIVGTAGNLLTNTLRKRLETAKRDAMDEAMGKGESWTRKVLNDGVGVPLDDFPRLIALVGLKLVSVEKVCVDREVAEAMNTMHRKLAPHVPKLLWDDE